MRCEEMAMTDHLPNRPSHRQVVFVVDPLEIEAGGASMSALARMPHVQVLSSQPDHTRADELVKRLERQGLLQTGQVLLLSPYDDQDYRLAEEAADAFSLQKFAAFIRVCQLLGVRKVGVKTLEEQTTKQRIILDADGRYVAAKGKASLERAAVEEMASKLSWQEEFPGAEPDIVSARELVQKRGLESDTVITSLVDSCADQRNPPKRRVLTVDLSQEGVRTLNAAARLDLKLLSGSVNLKRVAETSRRFQVTYEVNF